MHHAAAQPRRSRPRAAACVSLAAECDSLAFIEPVEAWRGRCLKPPARTLPSLAPSQLTVPDRIGHPFSADAEKCTAEKWTASGSCGLRGRGTNDRLTP